MKRCVNGATTRDNAALKKGLAYYEKHGYDFIEIRPEDQLPE
ncbi:isomerase, partial [Shouchella clausii]